MKEDMILQIGATIIGTLIMAIGSRISMDIRRMTNSVEHLNEKMARVIERVDNHEKRIDRLETD